jgi:ADP-ribosylglycohydrolase
MESLTHGLSYEDQMSQYVRWADEGYMTPYGEVFDMGISIRKALLRFLHGTPALSCGSTSVEENGNGSLMRVLPLAMYLHAKLGANFPYQNQAYDIIHKASSLTHAHPISQMACSLYCCVANELLCRRARPEHLQNAIARGKVVYRVSEWAPWLEEFARVDIPTLRRLPRHAIQSSGYVVSTLEAALWCLLNTDSYQDCVLQAVNLGEDTDTVAAVAGGLAGLKYGIEDIPQHWLDTIPKREEIEGYCAAFAESL